MARKLQVEWQEDAETLKTLYRKETDVRKRQRLHAFWLVRQGRTMAEVAPLVGVTYRTLQRWMAWYREGGLEAVLSRLHGGARERERRLSPAQEAELKALADSGAIRSVNDAVRWAKETHQVEYKYGGMRYIFARLGLRRKVPRRRHPKASAPVQEAWKKGG